MSLIELIGETRDPGPIGNAEKEPPPPSGGGRGAIVGRGMMAIAIVIGVIAAIVLRLHGVTDRIVVGLAVMIYGLLAYLVSVRPRVDNVGWARGLFDHPFRWSMTSIDRSSLSVCCSGLDDSSPAAFVTWSATRAASG
jgi:hypothetical protein